jgi:hypothetical protein
MFVMEECYVFMEVRTEFLNTIQIILQVSKYEGNNKVEKWRSQKSWLINVMKRVEKN